MRIRLFILAILLANVVHHTEAQWVITGNTNSNNTFSNGKAGIGLANTSSAPTERVQLNGGNFRITGTSSTSTTYTPTSFTTGALLMGNTATSNSWLQSYSTSSQTAPLLLNAKGGNVGIGTSSPTAKLSVQGSGSFTSSLGIATGSTLETEEVLKVVGQTVFTDRLRLNPDVAGPAAAQDALVTLKGGGIYMYETNVPDPSYDKNTDGGGVNILLQDNTGSVTNISQQNGISSINIPSELCIGQSWDPSNCIYIFSDGKMSLGTQANNTHLRRTAGYRLFVREGILTEKLKLAVSSDPANWADYVFDEEYPLASLEEVEKYIQAHKHLPEVPSAASVYENGLDVAQMDALLLKKVEELTLHLIEMKKENTKLENDISTFSK